MEGWGFLGDGGKYNIIWAAMSSHLCLNNKCPIQGAKIVCSICPGSFIPRAPPAHAVPGVYSTHTVRALSLAHAGPATRSSRRRGRGSNSLLTSTCIVSSVLKMDRLTQVQDAVDEVRNRTRPKSHLVADIPRLACTAVCRSHTLREQSA